MLAGHLNLKNFVLLIDYNKISSIKETNKVVNLEPLSDKLSSFGFTTQNVDGHNTNAPLKYSYYPPTPSDDGDHRL